MKKFILLSMTAVIFAACGTPKVEETPAVVADSTTVCVDTCKVDSCKTVETATTVATSTVK
jgi:hypothetical protein